MEKLVTIHCEPAYLDEIKELGLTWEYSPQFGKKEIDVIVKYIESDSLTDDPDLEICSEYGINYDFVNCIEARNYVAWVIR